LGYEDAEIVKIFDHRVVLGALELNRLRIENKALLEEKAQAKDSVKRVTKQLPALQKPGKARRASKAGVKRSEVSRLAGNLKKSGKVQDAALVIEQMI
jgi:hypothetical protein